MKALPRNALLRLLVLLVEAVQLCLVPVRLGRRRPRLRWARGPRPRLLRIRARWRRPSSGQPPQAGAVERKAACGPKRATSGQLRNGHCLEASRRDQVASCTTLRTHLGPGGLPGGRAWAMPRRGRAWLPAEHCVQTHGVILEAGGAYGERAAGKAQRQQGKSISSG